MIYDQKVLVRSRGHLGINIEFQQALEIMENLENHQKNSMHGKIMEFKKN